MSKKRNATGLSLILAVDKPAGMSSHDVVNAVRKATGERRVGHAGTLDPLACGLLLVCVGPATRLADYLMAREKTYEACIRFGTATSTDDAEGEVLRTALVPAALGNAREATCILAALVGELEQVPPAYSALKREGVVAYKAARSGKPLALEARTVRLFDASLLAIEECKAPENTALPEQTGAGVALTWRVRLSVSKGFYVRSFARELGEHLGTVAHLSALRRTGSGALSVEQACTLDELSACACAAAAELLPAIDPVRALGATEVPLNPQQACEVSNGRPLALSAHIREQGVAVSSGGVSNVANTSLAFANGAASNSAAANEAATNAATSSQGAANAAAANAAVSSQGAANEAATNAAVSNSAAASEAAGGLLALTYENRLLALYERAGASGLARPKVVIPGGVWRGATLC